jgi:Ca2+-binding EF-hand superfamily protein
MKLLVAAIVAVALGTAAAVAQPVSPPPGVAQGTTPLPMPRVHAPPVIRSPVHVLMMVDAVTTRDDFLRHVRTAFQQIDANHDGSITRREVAARHNGMMREMHAAMDQGLANHAMRAGNQEMAMPDPATMFDRLDANHDGAISRQEFMAAHARMQERRTVILRGADMRDSHAGMASMESHMRGMGNDREMPFLAHLFDAADANHNGRVTLQEAEAAALAHFDRMDLNHDGRLTPEERREAHAMMDTRRPR